MKNFLAALCIAAYLTTQATAATYFYDFTSNNGSGENDPFPGSVHVNADSGTATGSDSFGSITFSGVNGWSNHDIDEDVTDDYVFTENSNAMGVSFTLDLAGEGLGNTQATVEWWAGGNEGGDVGIDGDFGNAFTSFAGDGARGTGVAGDPGNGTGAPGIVTFSSDGTYTGSTTSTLNVTGTDTRIGAVRITTFVVPEPATFMLIGLGVAGVACTRRKRNA